MPVTSAIQPAWRLLNYCKLGHYHWSKYAQIVCDAATEIREKKA